MSPFSALLRASWLFCAFLHPFEFILGQLTDPESSFNLMQCRVACSVLNCQLHNTSAPAQRKVRLYLRRITSVCEPSRLWETVDWTGWDKSGVRSYWRPRNGHLVPPSWTLVASFLGNGEKDLWTQECQSCSLLYSVPGIQWAFSKYLFNECICVYASQRTLYSHEFDSLLRY